MQVTILGSGTSVPRARRAPSGVLVQEGSTSLLLDGGAGTLTRMAEAGVLLEDLDRAMYTHLHMDHTGDLAPTLFALRNPDLHRTRPLDLHGPPGLAGLLERLRAAWGSGVDEAPCGVRVHAWDEDEATVFAGWRVERWAGLKGLREGSARRVCAKNQDDIFCETNIMSRLS